MVWYSISSACCVHRVMCLCLCEWLLRRSVEYPASIHMFVVSTLCDCSLCFIFIFIFIFICVCVSFSLFVVFLFLFVFISFRLWGLRVCLYPSINRVSSTHPSIVFCSGSYMFVCLCLYLCFMSVYV